MSDWPTIHAKDMHPVPVFVTPEQLRQIVREEIEAARPDWMAGIRAVIRAEIGDALQRMLIGESRLKTCLAHGDDEKCEACKEDDARLHALEHTLKSFVDFMENPTIAGDTFATIKSYDFALRQKALALLEQG